MRQMAGFGNSLYQGGSLLNDKQEKQDGQGGKVVMLTINPQTTVDERMETSHERYEEDDMPG